MKHIYSIEYDVFFFFAYAMHQYTGMNGQTNAHYHRVAAQMQDFMNQRSYGNSYGYQNLPVNPAQIVNYGAQRLGVNPVVANQIGTFARGLMRNILS